MTVPDAVREAIQALIDVDPAPYSYDEMVDALAVEGLIVYRDQLEQVGSWKKGSQNDSPWLSLNIFDGWEPVFRLRPTNEET